MPLTGSKDSGPSLWPTGRTPQIVMKMLFWPMIHWLLLPSLLLGSVSTVAYGGTDPATLCVSAARVAAKQTGVPLDALLAISVVETGRGIVPWPWTVNLGGEGRWLETSVEAVALVQEALDQGATNIDIGCFQLNYRWHARAFVSVEDMLDPGRNALYAAGYLAQQHARTGDWTAAAAAFHSATPEHADRYRARYEETLASLGSAPEVHSEGPGIPRDNGFPLLLAGTAGRNGSLVPGTSGGLRLIGEP